MKAALLSLIHEHPDLVYVFMLTLGWPLLSALGNLGRAKLAARWPRLAAALQASGFDPLGAARALAKRKGVTLPPPPDAAPPTPRAGSPS